MAGNIKGITIEFSGNTTKLQKALREMNKETRETDKELRAINKALKFNPGNTQLLAQKQQLLGDKVQQTKTKLDALREAQRKFEETPGADKQSAEYRQLEREIIETESKLKHFTAELKKLDNIKFEQLGKKFKDLGNKMTSAGQKFTTTVTAPIVAGYTLAAKYASDYEENLNKLDVAFGDNAEAVKKWSDTAKTEFGLSKVQATDAASAFGALAKGIGISDKEAAGMSTTLAGLSADLGSYFNVGVDQSAKALEGIFTGESEALKKFGVVMTDTNLKQFAEDQGLVWSAMTQTEKTMLRYQYVLDKTKDAQGDFARTSDGTANSIKIAQASLQDLGTAIGTVLLPVVTPIIQKLTEWINKFNELSPRTQKIIVVIGMLAAVIGPLLIVFGAIASAIGSIIAIAPVLGAAFTALLGPVGLVIAAIAAAIAIGVALYKNWDKVKAFLITCWNGIKTAATFIFDAIKAYFTGLLNFYKTIFTTAWKAIKTVTVTMWKAIGNAITAPIRTAYNVIKAIVDKLKSIFKFKWSLPKIKLPHFKIKGKFGLNPPQVPHFSIDWYKKGGIFNSPSVIGVGEAGPEAVIPIDRLQQMMNSMADSIVNGIAMNNMVQRAAAGGEVVIKNYLFESGPQLGETVVNTYEKYSRILGKTHE